MADFIRCSMNDVHTILDSPATVSITAGQMKTLGDTVVIAVNDEVANKSNAYIRWAKKVMVQKDTGALTINEKVGLNASTGKARTYTGTDTVIGTVNKAVASAATEVEVFFNPIAL